MTAFRTHTDAFARANAQVLGISADSFAAAGEFEEKLGLEFPLLSDFPRNQCGRDYGTYNEQYGVVRDVYANPADFESHPVHAIEQLVLLGESP